jgi:hypothetical protein
MSQTFNFRRAWRELAKPAFDRLPQEVHQLYDTVALRGGELKQGKDLNVPFPDDDLRVRFEAIDSHNLAIAAHVLYFWGHWGHTGVVVIEIPGWPPHIIEHIDDFDAFGAKTAANAYIKHCEETMARFDKKQAKISYGKNGPCDKYGAHWKFTNLADQVLAKRLGCLQEGRGPGSFYVYEGMLRYGRSGNWTEVGWATEAQLDLGKHVLKEYDYMVGGNIGEVLRQELTKTDPDKAWFTTCEDYMDHEPGTEYGSNELPALYESHVAGVLNVLRVTPVNHKVAYGHNGPSRHLGRVPNDHPFMIGPKHMEGSDMVLDPTCAPCAACGMPYSNHTYDTAMMVQPARNLTKDELQAALVTLKDVNEEREDGIDGFGLVKHDEFVIEGVD